MDNLIKVKIEVAGASYTIATTEQEGYVRDLAKEMSEEYGIESKRAASILDTFSCIFQAIIPYGAQMLVALSAAAEFHSSVSAKSRRHPVPAPFQIQSISRHRVLTLRHNF